MLDSAGLSSWGRDSQDFYISFPRWLAMFFQVMASITFLTFLWRVVFVSWGLHRFPGPLVCGRGKEEE